MTTEQHTAASKIEAAMDTADRSAKWTADRAGIAVATFRRKLHGGGDFTVSEVARVAKALSIRPYELLPDEFLFEALESERVA